MSDDERFYADLPSFDKFAEVPEPRHYRRVPDSWMVAVTDVQGSTEAIEAGRYKDVNALGVASIVALRNALGGVTIAYVFGGDGATVLFPSSRLEAAREALAGIKHMARDAFAMKMRTGLVRVADLHRDGFEVQLARYRASDSVDLAMLAGTGVAEAERRVKADDGAEQVADAPDSAADFSGFECRWRPIRSRRGAMASLLVQARGEDTVGTYRAVLERIDLLLGEAAPGRPVDTDNLELQRVGDAFDQEARIRSGTRRGLGYTLRSVVAKASAFIGTQLMDRRLNAFGFPGEVYRDEVSTNTDFRKFDDMLRMVIDVSPAQLEGLRAFLDAEYQRGVIVYGLHTAPTSIMTCAIGDYHGDHVHFVDGADGGYALAAKQLKAQSAKDPSNTK